MAKTFNSQPYFIAWEKVRGYLLVYTFVKSVSSTEFHCRLQSVEVETRLRLCIDY